MDIETLKDFYNKIDKCTVILDSEVDFDYVQTSISKTAIYNEELNKIIAQLLIEKTKLEHLVTDKEFNYDVRVANLLMTNSDVKSISTSKERKDYINFFLMKDDYKELLNYKQELKDLENLLELGKKKSKDLDRIYPKLKTLWETIQSDMKYIKKLGSDSEYISKIKNSIEREKNEAKPIFTDNIVEQIKEEQYDNKEKDIKELDSNLEDELDNLLDDL